MLHRVRGTLEILGGTEEEKTTDRCGREKPLNRLGAEESVRRGTKGTKLRKEQVQGTEKRKKRIKERQTYGTSLKKSDGLDQKKQDKGKNTEQQSPKGEKRLSKWGALRPMRDGSWKPPAPKKKVATAWLWKGKEKEASARLPFETGDRLERKKREKKRTRKAGAKKEKGDPVEKAKEEKRLTGALVESLVEEVDVTAAHTTQIGPWGGSQV